jgi:hypothetical protein
MASITNRIALICLISTLTFPAMVFAGDAEDAVELLAFSLKCPMKQYKSDKMMIGDSDDPVFVHEINKWSGSTSQLRFNNEMQISSGAPERGTHVANFSDLESADTSIDRDTAPRMSVVSISCTKEAKCIRLEAGGIWTSYDYVEFHVCDKETASNAKLAIDTLIKLNKGQALPKG